MQERFLQVPETYYPDDIGGRVRHFPVFRGEQSGELRAWDEFEQEWILVEDESALLILTPPAA